MKLPYGEKFSCDKIFMVFVDLSQTVKISPTMQTTPFSCNRCGLLRSIEYSVDGKCTVILVAWTSYPNYQILLAPCLQKYRHPPLFWLIRERSSLVPRPHFSRPPEKWVWSTAYSIFVQVRRNVGALFFSNLTLDVIKDCIPHRVPTIY